MSNGKAPATTNTGKDNPGTTNRLGTDVRTNSAAAPITLKVPLEGWRENLLSTLERTIGIDSRTVQQPQGIGLRMAPPLREYDAFFSKVNDRIMNFRAKSKERSKSVTLYFSLPKGSSWADVRRNPTLLYTHVAIRHELELAEERRATGERLVEEANEAERKKATKLAEEKRERERVVAARKITELANTVAGKTMYWESGVAYGIYVNGDFAVIYAPLREHPDTSQAIDRANSTENRKKIERLLWDAYWAPGSRQLIFQIPKPVVTAVAPPPLPASTATENCDELMNKGDHRLPECLKRKHRGLAEDMRQGAMEVTEPAAAVLEALNPLDPVNLAVAAIPAGLWAKGFRIVGSVIKGKKQRATLEWVSKRLGSRGRKIRFEGDLERWGLSQKSGHHVYHYHDQQGRLLYVGKSGGVLGPKDPNKLANSWIDRLQADHIQTDWIFEARSVTVVTHLSEEEMWALEHALIDTLPDAAKVQRNIQPGTYYQWFRDGDLGANAAAALKKPQDRFLFEALPR